MPSSRFAAPPHRGAGRSCGDLSEFAGYAPASSRPLLLRGRPCCKSFDLSASIVNTATFATREVLPRYSISPQMAGTFALPQSFLPSVERQDPMNETEKARDKPASSEREAKRRERDKK